MPGRAFIPGPIGQAQPRVYKFMRGRQLKGLLISATGAALGLLIFGARDAVGYGATFLLAVPGFAYGYFQPEGKPVEYWFLVMLRFYFTPQQMAAGTRGSMLRGMHRRAVQSFRVVSRARRIRRSEGVLSRGRR